MNVNVGWIVMLCVELEEESGAFEWVSTVDGMKTEEFSFYCSFVV